MSKAQSVIHKFTTHRASETKKLAASLTSFLKQGDILSLTGDLGAGKTCFVQGLAGGLGVKERITSPTFTLIKEYQGHLSLYHFDVYRLSSLSSLFDLGYEEYFFGEGVTVVEWGDKISALFPKDYVEISFKRTSQESKRDIEIIPYGKWRKRVEEWLDAGFGF